MNKKMILFTLGKLLKVEAVLLLLPLLVSLIYREKIAIVYAAVSALVFIVGLLLSWKKPKNRNIYAKEGFFIVGVSWCLLSFFGHCRLFFQEKFLHLRMPFLKQFLDLPRRVPRSYPH